jgi:hypothetical protein
MMGKNDSRREIWEKEAFDMRGYQTPYIFQSSSKERDQTSVI